MYHERVDAPRLSSRRRPTQEENGEIVVVGRFEEMFPELLKKKTVPVGAAAGGEE
jgi:hypothetical protein